METRTIGPILLATFFLIGTACSSDSKSDTTDQSDSETTDTTETERDITTPTPPTEPTLPGFAQWTPPTCGPFERPIIGQLACQSVGTACPESGWPDAPVGITELRYVAPDGTGSGLSPSDPAGSIRETLEGMSRGAILLHAGTYDESLVISSAVQLVGACPSLTTIRSTERSLTTATVEFTGSASGISNVTITGPRPGVWLWDTRAQTTIQGVVIAEAEYVGMTSSDGNATVILEDVLIRDTLTSPDDGNGYGWGMEVFDAINLELRGVTLESNQDVGLYASGAGANISAEELTILRTKANPVSQSGGWGIGLMTQATMTVSGAYLYQNRAMGVVIEEAGSSLIAEDIVIRETYEDASDQSWGRAFSVRDAAKLTLTRAYLTQNRDVAILVMDEGTSASLTDVVVTETRHQLSDNSGGWALFIMEGSQVDITRARLENNQDVGILIDTEGSRLDATDLTIVGTIENPDGIAGWALGAQYGAQVSLERALFENNHEASLVLFGSPTHLEASDLIIRNTLGCWCADLDDGSCPESYGDGIELMGGSSLELRRFEISGNTRVGLATLDASSVNPEDSWDVTGTPTLTARDGLITQNLIGVNIQGDGVDVYEDFTDVLNYDNIEVDLAWSNLSMSGPTDATNATDIGD